VRPSKNPADRPILITEAPVNADEEFEHRRRRYLVMMALRAVCIIGAASTFSLSGWLAAGFVAAALVLPWTAVLIANDRPPKQELRFRRFVDGGGRAQRQLTSGGQPDADRAEPPQPRVIDI
jgi:Protein of unknown function (DUF3099)